MLSNTLIDRVAVPLWNGTPPFAHGSAPEDIPTITYYLPSLWRVKHKAVIILPGGGYRVLSGFEGHDYAEFLAARGYSAFVVNYRVGGEHGYRHPVPLCDAARAVRLVRMHAEELELRPDKIGIMGSSAGGHLAACCASLHETGVREPGEPDTPNSGRPDFTILCYPVISGVAPWGHEGSFLNLMGKDYDRTEAAKISMELAAGNDTPPAFLWHTWHDECVPAENSIYYALRLKSLGIPAELHMYENGPHALGLGGGHPWTEECLRWLEDR